MEVDWKISALLPMAMLVAPQGGKTRLLWVARAAFVARGVVRNSDFDARVVVRQCRRISHHHTRVGTRPQNLQQSVGLARNLHLTHDLARAIHNADARVLDRNVQSRKIVHAALLLLMLGARHNGDPVSPSA